MMEIKTSEGPWCYLTIAELVCLYHNFQPHITGNEHCLTQTVQIIMVVSEMRASDVQKILSVSVGFGSVGV